MVVGASARKEQKMEIARRYLVPKALHEAGLGEDSDLAPASLAIADDAIEQLARHYCREAGVRNLQQHIEKICRKLALKVVQQHDAGQGDSGGSHGRGRRGAGARGGRV